EAEELIAVVGRETRRCVPRHLGEVVEHPRLIDDEMWELADPGPVVGQTSGADDVLRVLRIGLPERCLGDAVGLGGDALGEAERLEGLYTARLDAVPRP